MKRKDALGRQVYAVGLELFVERRERTFGQAAAARDGCVKSERAGDRENEAFGRARFAAVERRPDGTSRDRLDDEARVRALDRGAHGGENARGGENVVRNGCAAHRRRTVGERGGHEKPVRIGLGGNGGNFARKASLLNSGDHGQGLSPS